MFPITSTSAAGHLSRTVGGPMVMVTGGAPMCLGVPGQIVEIRGKVALTDFWGVQREVALDNLTEPVSSGDMIIAHAGVAVRRIPPQEAAAVLAMYEVVLCEAGEDPIARDVIEELELEPV